MTGQGPRGPIGKTGPKTKTNWVKEHGYNYHLYICSVPKEAKLRFKTLALALGISQHQLFTTMLDEWWDKYRDKDLSEFEVMQVKKVLNTRRARNILEPALRSNKFLKMVAESQNDYDSETTESDNEE